jgi:hypothetical protein
MPAATVALVTSSINTKAAGHAVDAVVVNDQPVGCLQSGEANLVGR